MNLYVCGLTGGAEDGNGDDDNPVDGDHLLMIMMIMTMIMMIMMMIN